MSDAVEKLRAWVAEVEARHLEGESECMYCSGCSESEDPVLWPCDAARGAAVLSRVGDFIERALEISAVANNAPVHDAMMHLSALIDSTLEGK